jgi:ATP-dependent exoDNAse (exonuclease V) beta subunit
MMKTAEKTKAITPLKFPSVDVVEASAGSGKTYALAKRYIQLITYPKQKAEDMPLKTILAVTFTNKATIEMKQRILEFLKRVALDTFRNQNEKEDISSSIATDFDTAKKIAYKVMEDIISHYNFFQVQTIDSFINMLLSGCAFHLGFASNFRIKEEYRAYLEYSLDRLIDRVEADKNIHRAFEEFLQYYLFVENKEGWFSKRDILALVESLYNYSNTYGGIFKKPEIEAKDLLKKKREILKLIAKIRDNAPRGTDGRFINSLESFLEKNKESFKIEKLPLFFEKKVFPVKKDVEPPARIVKLWNDLLKNLGELCDWESFALFRPYIEIFNLVLEEFRKLSGTEDIIFLQELNTHARGLVGDEGLTVPEIYYRLATRFRHYLIDEFQDTSRLQWKNILPMVEEALSSGGTLFYVGDKKQAIYRFRGGDVSLFDSVQADFSPYEPKQAVLAKNYRSQKEIVEFNNEIFSVENLKRFIRETGTSQKNAVGFSDADIARVLNVFSDSRQEWKEENARGYVKVEAIDVATIDERDIIMRDKLVSLIKELRVRFLYGDLAILVRENEDVKLFTSWLIEENIPVESEKTLNIREHPLIKELISFLKFLNSPIDNLSFASFITGSIFQKSSRIATDTIRDFLFRLRVTRKKERGVHIYTEFRRKFPEAWSGLIEEFYKSVGFVPLYELVISLLGKFKVMENFPEYQGFFMRFLELIKEKEEDYSGISKFLEIFEEIEEKDLFVNVAHTGAVKIMTIHKAKGLEFSVVIIPFLEIDVTIGSGGVGSKKPYVVRQAEDNTLQLVQLKKKYGAYSEKLGEEYKDEYIKSLIDELNSLYVALTRAKYEMYVFIPSKTSNKNNTGCILVPYRTHERGTKIEYKPPEVKGERPLMTLPIPHYSDWIGVLKDEFIDASQLINRDKILKGEVLHLILSFIGNLHTEDIDKRSSEAKEKISLEYPYTKDLDEYFAVVRKLSKSEKLKAFFYVKEGNVYQEKEVVNSFGDTKRIDRLIVTPKEAWIVDYKSVKDDFEAYKEQIGEYMKIIKSLYPRLKVRGFLIYLDTLTSEEIYG